MAPDGGIRLSMARDGVALLTIDNQPMNLISLEITQELNRVLSDLAEDPAVRVLVLTGAGTRAFCAGSDVKEFPAYTQPGQVVARKLAYENETYTKLSDFPKPTIAALNGLAYGGGLELAVCCDLLVADAGVRLALPEVKLGVFPGSGGTARVTRRVGDGRAKELMFTGDPIDAKTALSWGLVNRVVPEGQALEASLTLAETIASRPNRALQLCKQAVEIALELPEDQAIRQTLALSDQVFTTEDCKEGVRAFLAKEPPKFTHR